MVSHTKSPLYTRFAPSPTGRLHLGHAYAALVAHETASALGGEALLRIEDLDQGRARAAFEAAIFEDLAWLGLSFAPSPWKQSERLSAYAQAIEQLTEMGLTYPCFCTRAETRRAAELGGAPHTDDKDNPFGPVYPGTCRPLSEETRAARLQEGASFALRLNMAAALEAVSRLDRKMAFTEAFAPGPRRRAADPSRAGDIVLARKDLGTSYHVAVVVDDAAQGITHVTRGEDLLASTHIHVLLQCLLGLETPIYGHHGLVRDDEGRRLAKRDEARSIHHFREDGLSPAEVLALLPPLPDLTAITSR